jgi:hypothetical protein
MRLMPGSGMGNRFSGEGVEGSISISAGTPSKGKLRNAANS